MWIFRAALSGLTLALVVSPTVLPAQSGKQSPVTTVPALFLSDIHLDPYADPAKVARLNAAPAAQWPAILSEPASATEAADSAALRKACPVRGTDTPYLLWQSSLRAIHTDAAGAKFVTISGDLLAHAFDCKFKTLLPQATPADYLGFTGKTLRTIAAGLRAELPGVPIYLALGNNDSGCTDYRLDPEHDAFLAQTAALVGELLPTTLSTADRDRVLSDFRAGGYYSAPLAAVPNTRVLVLDDLFLSAKYASCSGQASLAPASAQLAWLRSQLDLARSRHETVWVLGHIPPGADLYATARKQGNFCASPHPAAQIQMFLGSEELASVLSAYGDVIRLALFGHTHSDEMRLLTPEPASRTDLPARGVPVKLTASITPVNGNAPTFTVARIDAATATLADFTVMIASNPTGVATTWAPEYTYSSAYGQPAFNPDALTALIVGFRNDPTAQSLTSQAYLRNYFPGDISPVLKAAWPYYTCSMEHDSAQAFATCACATAR